MNFCVPINFADLWFVDVDLESSGRSRQCGWVFDSAISTIVSYDTIRYPKHVLTLPFSTASPRAKNPRKGSPRPSLLASAWPRPFGWAYPCVLSNP